MNYLVQILNCLTLSIGQAFILRSTYNKLFKSDLNLYLLFFVMFIVSLFSLILPVVTMQITTLIAASILVYVKSKKIVSTIIITLTVIIAEFTIMFLPSVVIMLLVPDWMIYRNSAIYNIISINSVCIFNVGNQHCNQKE